MDAQLEMILEAYATSEPAPSRARLAEWIREYPRFARELTEFTARWQYLEWTDAPVESEMPAAAADACGADDEEERLILRGMSAAQSVFYGKRASQPAGQVREAGVESTQATPRPGPAGSDAPIDSLIAAAKRAGLTFAALKDRVGLSESLLQKLNRRLIDPGTIPVRILADLAVALQQRLDSVAAYLARAPTFAAGAQHRADQAPTLPNAREDFFDATRNDPALSDTRKQELLSLPRAGLSDNSPEAGTR